MCKGKRAQSKRIYSKHELSRKIGRTVQIRINQQLDFPDYLTLLSTKKIRLHDD